MTIASPAAATPSPVTDESFAAGQALFGQWIDIVYHSIVSQLLADQDALARLNIVTRDTYSELPSDVFMKGEDPAEWRAAIYLQPPLPVRSQMTPEQMDTWRQPVDAWVLQTLQPIQNLLATLGVNDYLFEGLNSFPEGSEIPIEPYGDAEIVQRTREIMGLPILYTMQPTAAGQKAATS